jgi:3D (Asp-Asp-Asp) domain-containing protein
MISVKRIKRRISLSINLIRIRLHALRVTAVLAVCFIPDWLSRKLNRLQLFRSRPKTVALSVLLAAIVIPSALFVIERNRRVDSEQAYAALSIAANSESLVLKEWLASLLDEQASLKQHLLDAGFPVYDDKGRMTLKVLATGYSSSVIETDNTPFITAANTRTRPGVVAMSRDLLRRYTPGAPFDFGDRIHIAGLGEFSVEDSMNRRWEKRIDIWFPSRSEAFYFGKKSLYITKLAPES